LFDLQIWEADAAEECELLRVPEKLRLRQRCSWQRLELAFETCWNFIECFYREMWEKIDFSLNIIL